MAGEVKGLPAVDWVVVVTGEVNGPCVVKMVLVIGDWKADGERAGSKAAGNLPSFFAVLS